MTGSAQALKRKSPSPELESAPMTTADSVPISQSENQAQLIISSSPSNPQQEPKIPPPQQLQQLKKLKTTPAKDKNSNHPKVVVELDQSRAILTVKQKPIELCEVSNQVKKSLVAVTEELESANSSILDLSPSQTNLIGCLVHESDKTLSELTTYVHFKLLPQSKLLIEDEFDQHPFDPLPSTVIESAIVQVAERINYAPSQAEIEWLPSNLPKGFQIWRWECHHRETVIPSDLTEISQKRWEERQLIKPQICALLSRLDSLERAALLKKLNPKRQGKSSADNSAAGTSTPSSKTKPPKSPSEAKSSGQGHHSKTTNSKKVTNIESTDKVPTEKELIKQLKDQKRKDKEDAKLAEEQQKKKMGSLMSGWMTKAKPTNNKLNQSQNSNPPPTSVNTSVDNSDGIEITAWFKNGIKQDTHKPIPSDFEKTFKPFNRKSHVQLAPVNRFRLTSSTGSKSNIQTSESSNDLSPQECLDQFLKSVCTRATPQNSKRKIVTIREIVNGLAESELSGCIEGAKKWRRTLQNRSIVPVKFLRFHEDVRPGYIGTWCKTSRLVNGRNPFGKDTCLLDYDYDSEADWNEEDGEGEDLDQSDGGNEEGEGLSSELGDSDEDGWLVGDDDEIEMVDDGENHASNRALDLQLDDQSSSLQQSNKKIIGPTRRKIVGPLIPVVKGPIWEDTLGVVPSNLFESFRIQMINDAPLGLNPFTYEPKMVVKVNKPKLSTVSTKACPAVLPLPNSNLMMNHQSSKSENEPMINQTTGAIMRDEPMTMTIDHHQDGEQPSSHHHPSNNNFPNELIPHLIKLVNGNRKSKPILLEDLKNEFLSIHPTAKISKRLIEQTLGRFAVKVSGTWRILDQHSSS